MDNQYAVTVNVETARDHEGILLRYWTDAISESQARDLAEAIAQVFTCFVERPSDAISTLGLYDEPSRTNPIQSRNSTPNDLGNDSIQNLIDARVHEVVSQMVREGRLSIPAAAAQTAAATAPSGIARKPVPPPDRLAKIPESTSSVTLAEDANKAAEVEQKLWKLWSSALGLPPSIVKPRDSFFKLGGDSITAMKMVSAAREEGLSLTVADVFNNPMFADMLDTIRVDPMPRSVSGASRSSDEQLSKEIEKPIESKILSAEGASSPSVSVLRSTKLDDPCLQSGICPKVGVFKGGISDVLPVTDFQAVSITATLFKSRWMLNYFYLDGKGPLDLRRLKESCLQVVEAFDILRTVFVCFHGQFFQVVLRKVRPSIFVYETEKSMDEFTESLQQRDREQDARQGEQYVQFYIVKKKASDQHRILIRMSHTQFDGVCLSRIMSALKLAYEGSHIPQTSPFANYMRSLPGTITPEHYQHWKTLLEGASMTKIIQREGPNTYRHIGSFTELRRTIDVPATALGNVTAATVMQSAWAMTLAKLCAESDVVFGLTINGRNTSIPGVENTVGPCINVVPVRVKFGEHWTGLDLFRYIQDQQIANMPYEALGSREIIRHCTDWPACTYFTTSVFHQNVEYEGQMQLDRNRYIMGGAGVMDSFADLTLVSKPSANGKLDISLGYSLKSAIHPSFAARALEMVCDTAESLITNPNAAIPSGSAIRSLPAQKIKDYPIPSDEHFLSAQLKDRSISELLVHSDILTDTWQQVLPRGDAVKDAHNRLCRQPHFQLDSSFFELGGDLINMAQVVWLLEQEGLQVRLEDLLDHPTFLGHLAVLARHNRSPGEGQKGESFPVDEGVSAPGVKVERRKTWNKAVTFARRISGRGVTTVRE